MAEANGWTKHTLLLCSRHDFFKPRPHPFGCSLVTNRSTARQIAAYRSEAKSDHERRNCLFRTGTIMYKKT